MFSKTKKSKTNYAQYDLGAYLAEWTFVYFTFFERDLYGELISDSHTHRMAKWAQNGVLVCETYAKTMRIICENV